MTDQLEPIDDSVANIRKIDDSLARFSAAHDELEAEERQRRAKRQKFVARIEQTRTALQKVVSVGGPRNGRNSADEDDEEDEED